MSMQMQNNGDALANDIGAVLGGLFGRFQGVMQEAQERQQERQRQQEQQQQTVSGNAAGNPEGTAASESAEGAATGTRSTSGLERSNSDSDQLGRHAGEAMSVFSDILQGGLRAIGQTIEHDLPQHWQNDEIRQAGRMYQSEDMHNKIRSGMDEARAALFSNLGSTAHDREANLHEFFRQFQEGGQELPTSIEIVRDPKQHGGMVTLQDVAAALAGEEESEFNGDRTSGAANVGEAGMCSEPLIGEPECGICLRGAGELLFIPSENDGVSGTAGASSGGGLAAGQPEPPDETEYTILKRMCCNNGQCRAMYCLDCLDRYCKETALQIRHPLTGCYDARRITCPHCRSVLADNSSLTLIDSQAL